MRPPKEKVTINFARLPDGEVVAEVHDEKGALLEARSLGKCSDEEYRRLVEVINQEMPALGAMAVKMTEN